MSGDPRVRALVEVILETHRAPEEVCQACPELLPEVLDRLRRLRELEAQVDSWFPTTGSAAGPVVPPDGKCPEIPGYDVQAILGRGGMGIVYKARHLQLNRVVALKMLQAGAYAGAHERARFQREAQVVAGLRHANIVQVYDVGDHDGCPFFTMELLEGGSLVQALAGTPQPARPMAELLVVLAEAVHVAHQAGIVHRDLKPGNILLTAQGTPKVADFGLARYFEGEAALTLSGTRMGTPSYMAPEQVIGKAGTIGPAADIYALGVLLYEGLTGRPPFRGETASETERQVLNHEPVAPARLNPKVPRDLETICLKCLSKEPQRRYASAAALADDLTRFREGRPIQARPLGWGGRLWRWGRRKPTTAGLLAALLALFGLTVGGGLELGRRDAERQGRAREAVEAALAQVPGLRRLGRWPEAEAVLAQGRSRLEEAGSDDLRRRLVQADDDLRLAAVLERIRLTPAIEASRFDFRGMAEAYARAFEHAGLHVRGDEKTVAARIRDSELRRQLVTALDHWAYVADAIDDQRSLARLLELARRVDPDPRWGDRFRDPDLWGDRGRLRRLAEEAEQGLAGEAPESGPPTPLVTLLAKKLGQKDGQAEPLLRAAQARHPEDFWPNFALGEALRERKPAEAVGFYRAALVTRPTVAAVHLEIGVALLRLGQADEAIRTCRKAVELEPTKGRYHFYLGRCLQARGRLDEAMAEFRRAIELDPKGAPAHHVLGICWRDKGRLDEAMTEYRGAIDLDPTDGKAHYQLGMCRQARGELDEAMAEYLRAIDLDPNAAWAHILLGTCWKDMGRLDEAMAEFRRAIELDPKGAWAHSMLGMCLQARGELDEAMAEYRRAIDLDPKGASAHHQLGMCWQDRGQLDEAMAEYRRAIDLDPNGSPAHHGLGMCWQAKGELDEAMAEYLRAIDLDPKGCASHHQLGLCWQGRGQLDGAMAEYRRAIDLDPKCSASHYQLGTCRQDRGQFDEAVAEYRRAIDLDPGGGMAHESLAEALLRSGRFTEVRTAVRRAFDLLSAEDPHRPALQETLNLCERMLALGPRLSALLQGKERPSLEELLGLAHLCQDCGRPDVAAGLYATVFAARPALADDLGSANRYNAACAAAQAADGARLGETERAGLRRQALDWLRADLAQAAKLRRDGKSGGPPFTTWRTDTDLAAVRDQVPLAKLPATEREEWRRLWADVDASLAADPLEQGRVFAARRDWARAADCYTKAIKGGATNDGHVWFEYAAVLLLSGDSPGYVRACASMIERCGKAGGPRSYHVARACTLAPDAVALASLAGRLAEKELQASTRAFWSLTEQGALAYRAGRFQPVVPLFEQSLQAEHKSGRAVLNWLWLALANQRLGKAEEARRWLEKAQAWLDQYRDGMPARAEEELGLHYHNWLEAHVLRREAEALIPSTGPRSGPENRERGAAQK